MIVEDNVCSFPAIPASGRPWVRIVSCNPLEIKDPELPPPYTGLPIDDRSSWDEYRDEYRSAIDEMQASFSEFCVERGAPPLPDGEMIHASGLAQPLPLSAARSTTRARCRSARPGTTSNRASAPPTPSGRCRPSSPIARVR